MVPQVSNAAGLEPGSQHGRRKHGHRVDQPAQVGRGCTTRSHVGHTKSAAAGFGDHNHTGSLPFRKRKRLSARGSQSGHCSLSLSRSPLATPSAAAAVLTGGTQWSREAGLRASDLLAPRGPSPQSPRCPPYPGTIDAGNPSSLPSKKPSWPFILLGRPLRNRRGFVRGGGASEGPGASKSHHSHTRRHSCE